jgi:hypothetical protein
VIAAAVTPTEQLNRPSPITLGIDDLIRFAGEGRLRVPAFQRSFVWDAEDVRKLFDSIWRGYPIGTLLLWKRSAPSGETAFGPLRLAVPAASEAYWVVDGQQRVVSLVASVSQLGAGGDPRFELCFDLRTGRFVNAGKRAAPAWWLPIRVVLESRTQLSWLREFGQGLSDDELNLADALGGALRDYRIPAYVIENDDEALLREVFDRVNSAGKRISRAQIFHALFAGDTEPGSARSVAASLRHVGFGEPKENRVVQSLLAIRGGDVARDLHDEFDSNENQADWYDATEAALTRVFRFLRAHGVPHLLLTPSTFPLPVLAAFFHLHPDPDPWNEQLLARWVWRGWANGFGRSGQTPALRQAVRAVHPRKGRPESAPAEHDAVATLLAAVPDEPARPAEVDRFQTNEAASRLALLALASLDPRDLDGAPLDLAAELEAHGVDAVTELVPGHRTWLGARGFWPGHARRPTGAEPADVLDSHAIDPAAARLLASGDGDAFVAHRGLAVSQLTQRFTDAHLQSGSTTRPPLADLLVGDEREPDDEPG